MITYAIRLYLDPDFNNAVPGKEISKGIDILNM